MLLFSHGSLLWAAGSFRLLLFMKKYIFVFGKCSKKDHTDHTG